MPEITVQVQQPLVDFADGETVTLEHTPYVDKLIAAGRVAPIETTELRNGSGVVVRVESTAVPVRPAESAVKAAWKAYAEALGADVDGMTKEQIIAAVAADDLLDSDLDGLGEFADDEA